jgi:hypothetical protein
MIVYEVNHLQCYKESAGVEKHVFYKMKTKDFMKNNEKVHCIG